MRAATGREARESGNYTCQWSDFGRKVIDRELQFWKEDAGLSELCGFGLELVAAGSKPVHEVLVQAPAPRTRAPRR